MAGAFTTPVITGLSLDTEVFPRAIDGLSQAVKQALFDAGVSIEPDNAGNFGLFMATTFSNYHTRMNNFNKFLEKGLRAMNPADAPSGLISYVGGQVCIHLGIKGMQSTVSSGVSSGFDALFQAMFYIGQDLSRKAIVVELGETFSPHPSCTIRGQSCLVPESRRGNKGEKAYGTLLGLASYYEK